MNKETWFCQCGKENEGKFCKVCGTPRPVQETTPVEPVATPVQPQPPVQPVQPVQPVATPVPPTNTQEIWVCQCGKQNTKQFCTTCGSPKPIGFSQPVPPVAPPMAPGFNPQYNQPQNFQGNLGYQQMQQPQNNTMKYIAIMVVALIAGGAFFFWNKSNNEAQVAKQEAAVVTEQAAPVPVVSIDKYVTEKNDIDIAISDVANKANKYMASHQSFAGAEALKQEAYNTMQRAKTTHERLSKENVATQDKEKKTLLLDVINCEIDRARGLYKGINDSQNGGDYSLGFGEGSKASYKYDELNQQYNSKFN